MPTLDQLRIGQRGRIETIAGSDAIVQRLYEMGLLEGEEVELVGVAPFGDPLEISLSSYRLSLRRQEAARVTVPVSPTSSTRLASAPVSWRTCNASVPRMAAVSGPVAASAVWVSIRADRRLGSELIRTN